MIIYMICSNSCSFFFSACSFFFRAFFNQCDVFDLFNPSFVIWIIYKASNISKIILLKWRNMIEIKNVLTSPNDFEINLSVMHSDWVNLDDVFCSADLVALTTAKFADFWSMIGTDVTVAIHRISELLFTKFTGLSNLEKNTLKF